MSITSTATFHTILDKSRQSLKWVMNTRLKINNKWKKICNLEKNVENTCALIKEKKNCDRDTMKNRWNPESRWWLQLQINWIIFPQEGKSAARNFKWEEISFLVSQFAYHFHQFSFLSSSSSHFSYEIHSHGDCWQGRLSIVFRESVLWDRNRWEWGS